MFKIFLLSCIILANFTHASSILSKEMAKFKKQCNQKLVTGYGMKGLKYPKKTTLAMCPLITKSCCSIEDQQTMYANWVHSKEKLGVETRFKTLTVAFGKTIDLVKQTMKLAKSISHKLNYKLLANCKLLAKKILMFEMDQTGAEIMKAFAKMEKYMTKVYSFMYCAVCDHSNHLLFDVTDNSIYYSQNFCRSTVEHILVPVIYMNVHFKYIIQAVTRFVSSCDFKGMFTRDVVIPPTLLFPVDEKIEKSLLECRNNRNKPDWFVECEPMCSEVKLTDFSNMLAPDVEPIIAYNKFLDKKLKAINNEARLKVISAAGGTKKKGVEKKDKKKKKVKKTRILTAKAPANKDEAKKANDKNEAAAKKKAAKKPKKKKSRKIYFTAKGTYINSKTVIEYAKYGMNLEEIGKNSLINQAMFNQVKSAIALKKMKKKGLAGGLFHRKIKKSGLFGFESKLASLLTAVAMILLIK